MKPLLRFSALCLCTGLAPTAFAAPPPRRSQNPPQNTTQMPAPIVRPGPIARPDPAIRPKPIVIKPRPAPAAGGATGSTGAVLIEPIRPRPAAPAAGTGSTGYTGSTGSVATTIRKPAAAKPATVPALPAKSQPATVKPARAQPAKAQPGKVQPFGTAAVPFNRTTIVLDPSHGGVDGGSRITDTLQEKDVDLALAFKLRSLLTVRGFNVVLTRDDDAAAPADAATPLSLDDRAGTANHLHPVACLLLHATGSGKGVHLYSSELAPLPLQPTVVPWLSAQASWVSASRALQQQLGTALSRAEIPLVLSRASIRPLDSLTCPALVLELAPNGSDKESVNDGGYQQRIANAIAAAMIFWQNQAQPPDRQVPAPPPAAPSSAPATAPSTTPSTTPSTAPSTMEDQP